MIAVAAFDICSFNESGDALILQGGAVKRVCMPYYPWSGSSPASLARRGSVLHPTGLIRALMDWTSGLGSRPCWIGATGATVLLRECSEGTRMTSGPIDRRYSENLHP